MKSKPYTPLPPFPVPLRLPDPLRPFPPPMPLPPMPLPQRFCCHAPFAPAPLPLPLRCGNAVGQSRFTLPLP